MIDWKSEKKKLEIKRLKIKPIKTQSKIVKLITLINNKAKCLPKNWKEEESNYEENLAKTNYPPKSTKNPDI